MCVCVCLLLLLLLLLFLGGIPKSTKKQQQSIANNIDETEWIYHFDNVFNEGVDRRNRTTEFDLRVETADENLNVHISR